MIKSFKLPDGRFLRQVTTLMSGTVVAQAITFGMSFILTRLYSAAEFGHYSVFVGLASVVATISTGALESAIVLSRSRSDVHRVQGAALMLSVATALLAGLIGLAASQLIPMVTGGDFQLPLGFWDLTLFLPMFVLCYGIGQISTFSNLRADRMNIIAGFKVGQSALMGAIQVAASMFRISSGLIVGTIVGWLLLAGGGVWAYLSGGEAWRGLRLRTIRAVLRRHWRYPRYVMPNRLIDNFSNQAPILLIGTFLSLSVAGHYGLAIMIMSAPAALVGQAAAQAFLHHIGRHEGDPHALVKSMRQVWTALALIGVLPFAIIMAFGPAIFEFGFGKEWSEAGVFAQFLAPLLLIRFVSSPTSSMYLKLDMQREQWWFALAAFLYRPAAYALAIFDLHITTLIAVHVLFEAVAIILYNALVLRRLKTLEWKGVPT